jgi:hypothetical protein
MTNQALESPTTITDFTPDFGLCERWPSERSSEETQGQVTTQSVLE